MKSRLIILASVIVVFIATVVGKAVLYAADSNANITVNVANVQPREVEDLTERALVREYGAAWQTLSKALKNNDIGALDQSFVGTARDRFAQQIEQQKSAGMSTTYLDKGHKLDVLFYSPEGSAIQFRDTASLELQVYENGKLIHTEPVQQQYVGLMTVYGDRWRVRVLQPAK
jgi:hypothetical protein